MPDNYKTLILGQIPDNFDPNIHIPIAPFCFANRENIYSDWTNLNFEDDPFPTNEALKKAEHICNQYAYFLLKEKTEYFNTKLKLNFSEKFWKIILFPWLIYAIQSTYEKQVRIYRFIRKHSKDKIHVKLVKDNIDWSFKTCLEYIDNGLQNSIYNEWVLSRLLENNIPTDWTYEYIDKSNLYSQTIYEKKQNIVISLIKKTWLYKFRNGFSRVYEVYGMKLIDFIIFNIVIKYNHIKKKNTINDTKIQELAQSKVHNLNWILDFDHLIEKTTPRSIWDIPKNIRNKKPKKALAFKKNLISAAQITNTDNKLKIKFALRYELGENLLLVQHGGHNYGTSKLNSIASMVEYNHFQFITWGWTAQEEYEGNFTPLPSPYLTKFYDKHKCKNQKIIVVGNYMNYYFISFTGSPQSKQQLDYRLNKKIFLTKISDKIKPDISYRPYSHNHYSYEDANYISSHFPNINILSQNLHSEILTCKLLVLDHPGTTFLIALASNVPFICFWDKSHFPFSKQANQLLSKLYELGIYYNDAEEAALKVNKIADSPLSWWYQKDIQEIRILFLNNHGLTNKYWRHHWIKYLYNI